MLVHGGCCAASDWRHQIDALSADATVLAMDLRGHGASGGGTGELGIARWAADVNGLIEALDIGPAVIVGHADTRTGPSVFHDLHKLKPGQRIEVFRRDRRVAVFEVNSVEHFGKTKLPVQRVYGDFRRPSLRLVTCGVQWQGGSTGYSDNVVVFASLVASRRA